MAAGRSRQARFPSPSKAPCLTCALSSEPPHSRGRLPGPCRGSSASQSCRTSELPQGLEPEQLCLSPSPAARWAPRVPVSVSTLCTGDK